jgi:hypothetical protein
MIQFILIEQALQHIISSPLSLPLHFGYNGSYGLDAVAADEWQNPPPPSSHPKVCRSSEVELV